MYLFQEFIYNVSKHIGLTKSLTLDNISRIYDTLYCQVWMNFKNIIWYKCMHAFVSYIGSSYNEPNLNIERTVQCVPPNVSRWIWKHWKINLGENWGTITSPPSPPSLLVVRDNRLIDRVTEALYNLYYAVLC